MHRHLLPRRTWLKQRPFPPSELCCLTHHWTCVPPVLWSPPTSHPTSLRISPRGLYLLFERFCAVHRMRHLLFHRLLSQHPILPTPESSSRLFPQGSGIASGSWPLLLPSPCVKGSALSCSPYGANMSVLQVSLYVTGCCFASLPQEDTTLRHRQSPGHIGCLLSGGLTLTRTGLHLHRTAFGAVQVSPASRR